jgi:hypothetical protein
MLGIGKVAYWTGSKGRSTLLGLDIDDHQSNDPALVHENCSAALDLFIELTGWKPVTCPSRRGIHGFLILDKGWLTAQATNELWHYIVRAAQAEGKRRGLIAKLECKGKARFINDHVEYAGVLLKDPFTAMNPSDYDLTTFWATLEERRLSDTQFQDMLTTLASLAHEAAIPSPIAARCHADNSAPTTFASATQQGAWLKNCKQWATDGLSEHDSMADVVFALSKWFYFVEFYDMEQTERFNKVVYILQQFCLLKHNGYITRLNNHKPDEVLTHVERIVAWMVQHATEAAKACFARIRNKRTDGQYADQWFLEPVLSNSCSSSSVTLTECCSVSPKREEEDERPDPNDWVYTPDLTPLPKALETMIRSELKAKGAREKTYGIIVGLLNHIRSKDGDARLGIESLKKMGFSDHRSRQYITMLRQMGLFFEKGYSPAVGLGKQFVFTVKARELFGMPEEAI